MTDPIRIFIDDLATPRLRTILHELAPEQRRAMLGRLGLALEVRFKSNFLARGGEIRPGLDKRFLTIPTRRCAVSARTQVEGVGQAERFNGKAEGKPEGSLL